MAQNQVMSLLGEVIMRARGEVRRNLIERLVNFNSTPCSPSLDYPQFFKQLIQRPLYSFTRLLSLTPNPEPLTISVVFRHKSIGRSFLAERFVISARSARVSPSGQQTQRNHIELFTLVLRLVFESQVWQNWQGKDKQQKRLAQFIVDSNFQLTSNPSYPFSETATLKTTALEKGLGKTILRVVATQAVLVPLCKTLQRRKSLPETSPARLRRKTSVFSYYIQEDEVTVLSTSLEDAGRAEQVLELEEDCECQLVEKGLSQDFLSCKGLVDTAVKVLNQLLGKGKRQSMWTAFYECW